ncbi:MAG: hypothetical protein ACOX6L_11005 [Syntrophomonadaceae bacterium]|jgi:hypothetical protein
MGEKGLMYSAFHRFYGALQNLDKFSTDKDLIDNIANLDAFFSAFRSTSFVLQCSLAHTEHLPMYEELCEQQLKSNSVCKWMVETRNEVEKEHPIDLQKEVFVTVYSPVSATILHSEVFSVANDVEFSSIVDSLKDYLVHLNFVEVHFSLEFKYKKADEDVNLFKDITTAISVMRDFLFAVDDRIGSTTELCEELKTKIDELIVKLSTPEAIFIEDYVFYCDGERFERGEWLLPQLPEEPIGVVEMLKRYGAEYPSSDPKAFMRLMAKLHLLVYKKQGNHLMPAIFIVYANDTCRVISFDATVRTTTYRKINEIAARVIPDNIKYITLIHEAYTYDNASVRLLPYDKRIGRSTGEAIMVQQVGDGFVPRVMKFDVSKIDDSQYVDDVLKDRYDTKILIQGSMLYPIYLAIMDKRAKRSH